MTTKNNDKNNDKNNKNNNTTKMNPTQSNFTPPLHIPTDPITGYTKAFTDPADPAAREFYNVYGFVVVHNVLSHTECTNTINELWTYIEQQQWQRPQNPCYMANIQVKTIHQHNNGNRTLQHTTLPAMCAANGWNHLSKHIQAPIILQDNPYQPATCPQTPYVAMVTNLHTQQETVTQKIQRVTQNPGCAAVLVYEPSEKLEHLHVAKRHPNTSLFHREMNIVPGPVDVPILSVASKHPIAGAEDCIIDIDAEPTWSYPVVAYTQTAPADAQEANAGTETVTKTSYTHCVGNGIPLNLNANTKTNKPVQRYDTATWTKFNGWEEDRQGVIGTVPIWTAQFLANRTNEKVLRAMQNVLHTGQPEDPVLIVGHDSATIFRPMADANARKEWRTVKNIHFDCNPWKYFGIPGVHVHPTTKDTQETDQEHKQYTPLPKTPSKKNQTNTKTAFKCSKTNTLQLPPNIQPNYQCETDFMKEFSTQNNTETTHTPTSRVQGLLNLYDNHEQDGGFQCVPGAHRHARAWAQATAHTHAAKVASDTCNIVHAWQDEYDNTQDETDPTGLADHAQHISMPAGALLLWDYLLPHGTTPNKSNNLYMAQLLKAVHRSEFQNDQWTSRQRSLEKIIGTSICQQFGLQ